MFESHLYVVSQKTVIKIGKARNVEKRIGELQTGNPQTLFVYAVFCGMGNYESLCHKRLMNDRTTGEWFNYSKEFDSLMHELIDIANKHNHKYTIDNRFAPRKD